MTCRYTSDVMPPKFGCQWGLCQAMLLDDPRTFIGNELSHCTARTLSPPNFTLDVRSNPKGMKPVSFTPIFWPLKYTVARWRTP